MIGGRTTDFGETAGRHRLLSILGLESESALER